MTRYHLLAACSLAALLTAPVKAQPSNGTASAGNELARKIEQLEQTLQAQSATIQALSEEVARLRSQGGAAALPGDVKQDGTGKQQLLAGLSPRDDEIPLVCTLPPDAARKIIFDVSTYTRKCLKLEQWHDYNSVDLAIQLLGSSDGSVAEITPTYTIRRGPPREDNDQKSYRSEYWRWKLGVRVPLDDSKKLATFADLSSLKSGVAGVVGLEWGNFREADIAERAEEIAKSIVRARQECQQQAKIEHDSIRFGGRLPEKATLCDGVGLTEWMSGKSERQRKYYDEIVRPIWGEKAPALFFAGTELSYAEADFKFFPLRDPAGTGVPVITELPDNFPEGQTLWNDKNIYAIKGYIGRGIGKQKRASGGAWLDAGDVSASLTYRRDFIFASGTKDQQLCDPDPTQILCFKRNIAPPYELKGFVAGGRGAFRLPSFLFLPSTGLELRGTYDFEIDQFGLEVPFYFVTDKDGTPNGGIQLSYTTDGSARGDVKFEGDLRAAIFVGTEFKLDRR